MRISSLRIALLAVFAAPACTDSTGTTGWSSDPRQAMTPSGERPLVALDSHEVAETIAWAGMEIDEWRAEGVTMMIDALKQALAARKIDTSSLDKIDHTHIGEPLPRLYESSSTSDGVGQKRSALAAEEFQQYFSCPIMAPEQNVGTACDELVRVVLVRVQGQVEDNLGNIEQAVDADYPALGDVSRKFIAAWANAAMQYGATVAAVYAEHELRAANKCDDKANAQVVSFNLGIQQGIEIVEQRRDWSLEQVRGCVINTDHIAEQVRQVSKTRVSQYMEEHKVCVTADISETNAALKEAEARRREGILVGIDQRVEVLRQELFEQRRLVPCCEPIDNTDLEQDPDAEPQPAASCDVGASCDLVSSSRNIGWQDVQGNCVCCRRRKATNLLACKGPGPEPLYCGENRDGTMFCQCEAIPLGSPIVIDLDDDGLTLSRELVAFDLLANDSTQRITWVGPREGLLAIDLDGDGRIGSSAELFGNRSSCGERDCYDGAAALQHWDDPAQGGNGDGMLDRRDLVFDRLLVWVDANSDGVSQPGELQPLSAHGIVAINLDASYEVERRPEGSITAQLEVLTEQGFRRAYDVWFQLHLRPDQLTALMP